MVDFVFFFDTAQNSDGVIGGWFVDVDLLETTLECSVFFNILLVLFEGGGANSVEFTASQHRLQHIGSIDSAFGSASADNRVEFINKQDNPASGVVDFTKHGFETLFKFATEFGAGD